MHRQRNSCRAFTLIELLVVVAIIVALLAMLLPSMNKAIEVAERTVCGSQVHQLAIASLTYAADNHASMPADDTQANGNWMWDLTYNTTERMVSYANEKNDLFYDPSLPEHNADVHWKFSVEFRVTGYWFTYKRVNGPMSGWSQFSTGHPWVAKVGQASPNYGKPLMIIADSTISTNLTNFTQIFGGSPIPHRTPHLDDTGTRPAGGNVGYIDASVAWKPFDEMAVQYGGPDHWF